MNTTVLDELRDNAVFRLKEGQRMLHLAFEKMEDKDVWLRPNPMGNSLGNQILHSCGNMTQYIISSLGENADKRERDKEFSTQGGQTKAELLLFLDQTIAKAIETLLSAPETAWIHKRKVQGFELSGVGVVLHAVEHFSYHVGQVAFWVKHNTAMDLGFYADHDLTQRNQ